MMRLFTQTILAVVCWLLIQQKNNTFEVQCYFYISTFGEMQIGNTNSNTSCECDDAVALPTAEKIVGLNTSRDSTMVGDIIRDNIELRNIVGNYYIMRYMNDCNEPVTRPTGESRFFGSGASPATSQSMCGS
jgi:hypothetical protein